MGLCKCAFSPLTYQKKVIIRQLLFCSRIKFCEYRYFKTRFSVQKQNAIAKCDNIFNNVLFNKDSRTRAESDEHVVTVLQETDRNIHTKTSFKRLIC